MKFYSESGVVMHTCNPRRLRQENFKFQASLGFTVDHVSKTNKKEVSFSLRKEILMHSTKWINSESIMPSEINYSEKDKYFMIPLRWDT
jgi:hypothetical protein